MDAAWVGTEERVGARRASFVVVVPRRARREEPAAAVAARARRGELRHPRVLTRFGRLDRACAPRDRFRDDVGDVAGLISLNIDVMFTLNVIPRDADREQVRKPPCAEAVQRFPSPAGVHLCRSAHRGGRSCRRLVRRRRSGEVSNPDAYTMRSTAYSCPFATTPCSVIRSTPLLSLTSTSVTLSWLKHARYSSLNVGRLHMTR